MKTSLLANTDEHSDDEETIDEFARKASEEFGDRFPLEHVRAVTREIVHELKSATVRTYFPVFVPRRIRERLLSSYDG